MRTLTDNAVADRPMRRTALVINALSRYNVQYAALRETRLAGEGQLNEIGAGYTFFWSGRHANELRESGVGFVVKNCLVSQLASLHKDINNSLKRIFTNHGKSRGSESKVL